MMSFSTSFFTLDDDNTHRLKATDTDKKNPAEMDSNGKQPLQTLDDELFSDLPPSGGSPAHHGYNSFRSSVPPPSSDGFEQESVMDEDENLANGNGASNATNQAPKAIPRRKKGTAAVVKPQKRSRIGGAKKPKSGGSTKGAKTATDASSATSSIYNFSLSGTPGAGAGVRDGGVGTNRVDPLQSGSDYGSLRAGGNSSESDSGPYCLCRGPDNHRFMIACDRCEDWFHGECIGMDKWTGENLVQKYICPNCTDGGRYATRYKKMCSLSHCNRAARVDAVPRPSIFCSDEHCQAWWDQLIATLPKSSSSSSDSTTFFDTLTRDHFLGLLDAGFISCSKSPFAIPPHFWDSAPPSVLTSEESALLLQSAMDRHQLGEEIMLCKKMLQLVDMGIARREAAIAAGKGTNKDLCGYDIRLDVVGTPYQFGLFLQSPAGEAIFRSGKLDAVTENVAAGVLGNIRGGVLDEGISEDPVWGGMCLRKKCPPHKQWRDILTKMVKHSIRELAREASQKLDAEQRIRDSAAERHLRLATEKNSVEVGGSDVDMGDA
ncbi:Set1 complex component spp1 [Cladorrhinum sp. PSN332]|nr:Set1 complex component spp1 [Cladorrhinum sp. PSN332]